MYKKIIRYALISMLVFLCLSITNSFFLQAEAFYGLPDWHEGNFADKLEVDLEKACTGNIKIPGDSGKMKIVDGKLYVVNNTLSVRATDIFDPSDKFPGYSTLIDGKLYTIGGGNKLYEVNRGTSLQIINISDPNKIEIMDSFGEFQLDTILLDHYHLLDDPYYILENQWVAFDVRGSFINDFLVEDENFYFASPGFSSLFRINLSEPYPHIAGSFLGTIGGGRINIADPNNIYQEATTTINFGDILEIPSHESWIGRIKDNKDFIFHNHKFYVVDISDANAPRKIAELPLDSRLGVPSYLKCDLLLDDNLCYIMVKRNSGILAEDPLFYELEHHSQDLVTLDISDPNHPLFMSDLRIAFAPFDKKDIGNIDLRGAYNWWIFEFENLYSYNGYVFIKGEAGSGTRIYVVDTSVPANPFLVGYIDFPYEIKDRDFADNCLYLSVGSSTCNGDSAIYRYDLAKILPERIASSPVSCSQPEENQQPALGGEDDTPKEASGTTDTVKPEDPKAVQEPESPQPPEEPQQPSGLTDSVPAPGSIVSVPPSPPSGLIDSVPAPGLLDSVPPSPPSGFTDSAPAPGFIDSVPASPPSGLIDSVSPSGLIDSAPKETSPSALEETSDQQDQQKVSDQQIPEKNPDVPAQEPEMSTEKPPVSGGEISSTRDMAGSEENDKGDQPASVQPTSIQFTSIQPSYLPGPLPYWLSCNMLSIILPVAPVSVKSSIPFYSCYPSSSSPLSSCSSYSSSFPSLASSSLYYPYGYIFLSESFAAWPQEASGVSWYLPAFPFPFYTP
jgi:hypothetical protein